MGDAYGLSMYLVGLLTMGGIYGVLALGLNVHWGFTGLFNAGIAGFFAIGAYASALATSAPSPDHVGGFGLPIPVGLACAMVFSGAVAWAVGRICLRLRSDYLAIATIGIAEILRLVLKNEAWLTNGSRGISNIPRPFEDLGLPWAQIAFLGVVLAILGAVYLLLERGWRAPWGRVMRAIRENDRAAEASGKDVVRLRLEAFVIGSMIMGLGGALMAHSFKYIGPQATEPLMTTFLVWVMLIVGGSANNRGAILGAMVIWAIWSATELFTARLPPDWAVRAAYVRVFMVGLLLQVVLQRFARGLLPERPPTPAGEEKAPAERRDLKPLSQR
ncbi:branched-chain amino acid ABC transporter permease [Arenibaculum sp.]|uniref:branched-chain amino acid ABC transporter permease n=1 Tax=Arenibaculum sp. TaxID=2865862 RepID=UPI002E1376A6|nr:branched-chain amino acid ABC transporter permease [Arenibaculum sp.]